MYILAIIFHWVGYAYPKLLFQMQYDILRLYPVDMISQGIIFCEICYVMLIFSL